MEIHGIGELILKLREEKKVSQAELAEGLCTQKFLSKIEMGNSVPDSFLLDALMSRLGKAADKLEYVISEEDYQFFVKRINIQESLENSDYLEVKKWMTDYEAVLKKEDTLHFQYLDMMQAFLVWEEEDKKAECIGYLERAMGWTMPFWKEEKVWNHSISWIEAALFLIWAEKVKEEFEFKRICKQILEYIAIQWTDEEEKVKIYPFVVLLYTQCLMKERKYGEADRLSGEAISLLTRTNTMSNLLKLLNIRIEAKRGLKQTGEKVEDLEDIIKQKEALETMQKEYGYKENVVSIFTRIKREFYLPSEIICKNRKALGMTQEELSRDVCAQETLVRIEKGRTPQKTKFEKLSEKVSWRKRGQSNELGCWDYRLLEKKVEIDWLVSRYQYIEAKKKLEEFPCPDIIEAKQYVQYMSVMVKVKLGECRLEEGLRLLNKTLEMTLPLNSIKKIKDYVLTKQEVLILNSIGILYARNAQKEKAIQLYKDILQGYEQSKILPIFQAYAMLVVMGNLAVFLEEVNCFEEALQYMDKRIRLELSCKRTGEIAGTLVDIAYTLERQGKEVEKRKRLYMQAYYISDLIEDTLVKKIIVEHFQRI